MTERVLAPWPRWRLAEWGVVAAIALSIAAAMLLPVLPQDPRYHLFADQRGWLGIPHAADVLSNLAFLMVGTLGIVRLAARGLTAFSRTTEAGLWCAAVGFVLTSAGSAAYHWSPGNAALVWDRLPMTLVFAGVLGAVLAQRFGENAARVALVLLAVLGAGSVFYWGATGDLSFYITLQYGGMAALVAVLIATRGDGDPFPWWWVVGWYLLAKIFEAADREIWDATGGIVAGHTLKHLAAAAAGLALFRPLAPK